MLSVWSTSGADLTTNRDLSLLQYVFTQTYLETIKTFVIFWFTSVGMRPVTLRHFE